MSEPALRDVLAGLFARANASDEAADTTLTRGLNLRAAPTPDGAMRRFVIWRAAPNTPSMDEARICADAAGFIAYDADWTPGAKAIVISEREPSAAEAAEAERYKPAPKPAGPWIPGRALPADGNLEFNRLYHLIREEGVYYLMIRAGGPLQVHGHESVDVERGKAAHWLHQHGYQHRRITAGGYPL